MGMSAARCQGNVREFLESGHPECGGMSVRCTAQLRVLCAMYAVMNPPIQSMPPGGYQHSATPMYPLKPHEVPQMTNANSYADGQSSNAGGGYPPAAGHYPPSAPPQPPHGQWLLTSLFDLSLSQFAERNLKLNAKVCTWTRVQLNFGLHMYLDHSFGLRLLLSEITSLFGQSAYLD